MKTEEDEAFDDLAKRQGSWGGGYQAKRQMAADKVKEQLVEIEYTLSVAEPAQEPVAWTLLLIGEHHGLIGKAGDQFLGHPKHYERVNVYTAPPQRPWVGLTAEETSGFTQHEMTVVKYVSKVLQEKNNG